MTLLGLRNRAALLRATRQLTEDGYDALLDEISAAEKNLDQDTVLPAAVIRKAAHGG